MKRFGTCVILSAALCLIGCPESAEPPAEPKTEESAAKPEEAKPTAVKAAKPEKKPEKKPDNGEPVALIASDHVTIVSCVRRAGAVAPAPPAAA